MREKTRRDEMRGDERRRDEMRREAAVPWSESRSAVEWGRVVFLTRPTLSSPPLCIQHHHPGSLRPSSGSLWQTAHLLPSSRPTSPTKWQTRRVNVAEMFRVMFRASKRKWAKQHLNTMQELNLLAVDTLASDCGSIQQRLHSFSAHLEHVRPENTDAIGSEMYKDGRKRQCSRASVRTIRSRFECGSMAW